MRPAQVAFETGPPHDGRSDGNGAAAHHHCSGRNQHARRRRFKLARGVWPAPKGLRRGAELKDSTGIQASPNGMPQLEIYVPKGPRWRASRESDAVRSADGSGHETPRAARRGRRIPGMHGTCVAVADLMRRDFSAARDADRTSHRNRCHLATRRRRGASLERFTNANPLRPAPGVKNAKPPRDASPFSRREGRRTAHLWQGSAIGTDLIAKPAKESTTILKKSVQAQISFESLDSARCGPQTWLYG